MSFFLLEYLCRRGHRTESFEDRTAPAKSIRCGSCRLRAARTISAAHPMKVMVSAITRGKSDPSPIPPGADIRALGEGMSLPEWNAQRKKAWRDHDRKKRRARAPS